MNAMTDDTDRSHAVTDVSSVNAVTDTVSANAVTDAEQKMTLRRLFYCVWQWTWGFLQSAAGLLLLLGRERRQEHFWFHGAFVTRWERGGGVSLGMFLFLSDAMLDQGEPNAYVTHEYGHSIQSMLLGPLYLVAVGLPSYVWARRFRKKRLWEKGVLYFSHYPESAASRLGERITGITVPDQIPLG